MNIFNKKTLPEANIFINTYKSQVNKLVDFINNTDTSYKFKEKYIRSSIW